MKTSASLSSLNHSPISKGVNSSFASVNINNNNSNNNNSKKHKKFNNNPSEIGEVSKSYKNNNAFKRKRNHVEKDVHQLNNKNNKKGKHNRMHHHNNYHNDKKDKDTFTEGESTVNRNNNNRKQNKKKNRRRTTKGGKHSDERPSTMDENDNSMNEDEDDNGTVVSSSSEGSAPEDDKHPVMTDLICKKVVLSATFTKYDINNNNNNMIKTSLSPSSLVQSPVTYNNYNNATDTSSILSPLVVSDSNNASGLFLSTPISNNNNNNEKKRGMNVGASEFIPKAPPPLHTANSYSYYYNNNNNSNSNSVRLAHGVSEQSLSQTERSPSPAILGETNNNNTNSPSPGSASSHYSPGTGSVVIVSRSPFSASSNTYHPNTTGSINQNNNNGVSVFPNIPFLRNTNNNNNTSKVHRSNSLTASLPHPNSEEMLSPLQVHQSGQSTPYLTSFSPKTTERTVKTSRFMIADHSAQDERTIIDMLDMGEEDDDEELLWLDKNLAYEGEEAAAGGGGGSELLQEEAAEWPAAVRSDSTLIQTNEPSGGYWAMTEGPMIYLRPDVLLFANRGHTPVQGNSRKRTFSTHNNNNNSTTIPRTPLSSSIGYRSTYLDHTVSMETSGFYYGPNNNDNEEEEEHWEWEENSSAYEDSLDEAQIQWIEEQLRTREGSA